MSIGAVVVTFHTPTEQLQACLASLQQNGITDWRVVSNDQNNIGFAAASNNGARQLTNEFILFLNPDAQLLPNSIHLPLSYLSSHPKIGIIGPLLYSQNFVYETKCYGQPVSLWSLFRRRFTSDQLPANPQAVGWVSGGAMLIRRAVFEELSGFDSSFFLYWEDVDLCRRAWRAGWSVHLLPAWRVPHRRGASLSDQATKTRLYDKSADNYFRKHYSKPIWLFQRYLRFLYRLFSPLVE